MIFSVPEHSHRIPIADKGYSETIINRQNKHTSDFHISINENKVIVPPQRYQPPLLLPKMSNCYCFTNHSSILILVPSPHGWDLLRHLAVDLLPLSDSIQSTTHPQLLRLSSNQTTKALWQVHSSILLPRHPIFSKVCALPQCNNKCNLFICGCVPGGLWLKGITVSGWCWILSLIWLFNNFPVSH